MPAKGPDRASIEVVEATEVVSLPMQADCRLGRGTMPRFLGRSVVVARWKAYECSLNPCDRGVVLAVPSQYVAYLTEPALNGV